MANALPPAATPRTAPNLPLAGFVLAALTPVPLLLAGAWVGGLWLWAGFLYMAALSVLLDQVIPYVAGDAAEGQEFPGADALLATIGLAALVLLPVTVWAIAGMSSLVLWQKLLLFFGVSFWLGQIGHPAAHELIHRGQRPLFRLGQGLYAALLFGQHASAHRLVHHRFVASTEDPNSAREGESLYRFMPRAWWGSFRQGWQAEDALRARRMRDAQARRKREIHPYALYLLIGTTALILAFFLGGLSGVLIWAMLALHVQMQILVSDYVQHYGLRRTRLADGRLEPVGPQHSWNTAHWFSSAMMLHAPRHSDHHMHPARPYPALRLALPAEAPLLPWPLPMACTLAFLPRRWRRLMRPQLARWRLNGAHAAAPDPHGPTAGSMGEPATPPRRAGAMDIPPAGKA